MDPTASVLDELIELRKENRRLREVIEASPVHFCLYNEHDELIAWNPVYEQNYPTSFAEFHASGRAAPLTYAELVRESLRGTAPADEIEARVRQRVEDQHRGDGQAVIRRYGQTWMRVHKYRLPSGSVAGLAVDVTDLVEREHELIAARAAAEAGERAKASFLANMSHEIRTPMNGVVGLSSLLRRTALDDNQRHLVDTIVRSADALLTIINDVLDYSKIDAGRVVLREGPFDLRALTRDLVSLMSPVAGEKGVALRIDDALGDGGWFFGDAGRIRQCLLNLVGNAIKFTDRGEVVIRLERAPQGGAAIAVSDTGVGIDPEKIDVIFSAFEQVESELTRRIEGTGLGLAITDRLVRLQNGALRVVSVPGAGSTFTMTLPLPACAPTPDAAAPDADGRRTEAGCLAGATILLAEDNEINQMVFQRMLEPTGAEVVVCGDGEQAVALFKDLRPDCVLMDVSMPVKCGIAATEEIRAFEATVGAAPVPVLALTANTYAEHHARCRAAGVSAVLAKPITAEELIEAVLRARGMSAA